MSLPNPEAVVTEERLNEFYTELLPYLGGRADAGFTPVGTIIALMSNHAPANYLICDGTVYNIADYPELANHFLNEFGSKNKFGGNGTTTFAVPNLSGEFLRGTGSNGHTDCGSGSNVGTHQDPTWHRRGGAHSSNGLTYTVKDPSYDWGNNPNAENLLRANQQVMQISSSASGTNVSTAFYTARPTNTSVLFCIATKNIYLNPSLDYSTDEKVVGTWIDGKPIYQKTFSEFITLDDSSKEMQYPHNIANIDNVISASGFAKNPTNNRSYAFPQAYSDTYYYFLSANSININVERSNTAGWVGFKCTATILYTKTTD